MKAHIDEKGKYFTNVIPKDELEVVIQTLTHRIEGRMFVHLDGRLKDELNQPEKFLAVSEARVLSLAGEFLYSCPFMALNRDQIVWVMPVEENAGEQGGRV